MSKSNNFKNISKDFNPSFKHPLYIIRNGLLLGIEKFAKNLGGRLLDFGCGAKPYKELFINCTEYIGLDFESEGHNHKGEQIDFIYDGKKIPFPDNYFNSIFSSEVFEHVFNLEEILPELHRVGKNNCKLLITCPFVWNEHETPNDYARYTTFALTHLLQKNNFEIIEIYKAGNFIQTLHQLRILYFSECIRNKKIKPVIVRKITRHFVIPTLNIWYLFVSKFYCNDKSLYLNNIIYAEKK